MSDDQDVKQTLSAYLDEALSDEEKARVERLIAEEPKWKRYYEELSQVSLSLKKWQDAEPSPDFERKLKNIQEREGWVMKVLTEIFDRKVIAGAFVGVLAVVVGSQVYERMQLVPLQTAQVAPVQPKPTQPEPVAVTPTQPKPIVTPPAPTKLALRKQEKVDSAARQKQVAMRSQEPLFLSRAAVLGQAVLQEADYFGQVARGRDYQVEPLSREGYRRVEESRFLAVLDNPLSTFSVDVDTASYSNVRRFLNADRLPPQDAVRIEEMINYFTYDYPQPRGVEPFSVVTEVAACPWNKRHQLLLIGLQGKILNAEEMPSSNLVFLVDVSGSMNQPNKLPLLKEGFRAMVSQLGPEERVAIVTYAGRAGLVLESTLSSQKQKILGAIDSLTPGGSTAGAAGIEMAYEIAEKNLIADGNNRVILATDGDFNIGVSSDAELVRLIEEKRKGGVFLTVLGFGTRNYQDAKMEQLADAGNGSFYYIDSLREARKVLVHELGSTIYTIAKDVKLQIEFNPSKIQAYRLIGYENRVLAKEDFRDDKKDAGEIGAGHSVTALYELVLAEAGEESATVDPLRYQETKIKPSEDLLTVKLRYKEPDGQQSKLIEQVLKSSKGAAVAPSRDFQFASAVAEFGLLLRDSAYRGDASYEHVLEAAGQAQGEDRWGYREEFIGLVKKAKALAPVQGGGIHFKGDSKTSIP